MGKPDEAEEDFKQVLLVPKNPVIVQEKEGFTDDTVYSTDAIYYDAKETEKTQEYKDGVTYCMAVRYYDAGEEDKALELLDNLIDKEEKITEFKEVRDLGLLSETGKKAFVAIQLIANKASLAATKGKFPKYVEKLETTLTAKSLKKLKIS